MNKIVESITWLGGITDKNFKPHIKMIFHFQSFNL